MTEFQVELGFTLANEGEDETRDVDLLVSFGEQIEALAGDMGPATAIVGKHYTALLTITAETPIDAGRLGAEIVNEAIKRALADHDSELEGDLFGRYFPDRL